MASTADQSADYFAEDERRRAVYETEQARNRLHVALANNFTSQIVMGAISPAVPPTGAAGKTNSETEAADTAKKIDG